MKKLIASAFAAVLLTSSMAQAATPPPSEKARIDALQKQIEQLKAELDQMKTQAPAPVAGSPAPSVTAAPGQGQPAAGESQQGPGQGNVPGAALGTPPQTDIFGRPVDAQGRTVDFQPKTAPAPVFLQFDPKGPGITFLTPGGKVALYGNIDLSLDFTTKGLQGFYPATGVAPEGNNGWQPAISSNLSYFGIRGQQSFDKKYGLVYQLETQLDVSSSSGVIGSTSNQTNVVKGALTSRNSFIGVSSPKLGAIKIGKTDAPYKTSTARMNPFNAELGDYAVIMGNSGGDNRVEFGTRLDHSLWYESPVFNGFSASALLSPGMNRGEYNQLVAQGEADCTGGNIEGSGATPPFCNDGSFGSAYSYSVGYQTGKLYLTSAYELHKGVNRTSDIGNLDPRLVDDESAVKGGFQYEFTKGTSISGIYEVLMRDIPADLQYQNERARNGFWLALTQVVRKTDSVNFGWARANPSPGDPGQHNTIGGAHPDNMANLYTFAYKHPVNKFVSLYADYALTENHPQAHYDLGAGGRSMTTDCHDGTPPANIDLTTTSPTITGTGPHCYAGGHIQGFSGGIDFRF